MCHQPKVLQSPSPKSKSFKELGPPRYSNPLSPCLVKLIYLLPILCIMHVWMMRLLLSCFFPLSTVSVLLRFAWFCLVLHPPRSIHPARAGPTLHACWPASWTANHGLFPTTRSPIWDVQDINLCPNSVAIGRRGTVFGHFCNPHGDVAGLFFFFCITPMLSMMMTITAKVGSMCMVIRLGARPNFPSIQECPLIAHTYTVLKEAFPACTSQKRVRGRAWHKAHVGFASAS
ncbi:hypothetical protein BU24DRAFT_90169 [Aaosphaeria arxii CBS 175.79]|uniref:Uncharacterized protein n=1 Tax=Aaosphaeria arxii CBS 175.79 TaxID=1450172 RepID=A0A6A5X843_9PLEO|nr:uncharacterized protein BU24DRAFT_90169 [Aaosphaeria arxii CBS 175.79]KAF2009076.1 hypothetical protein BU24DRAFT_90169 [Aaosphaeria arxii CBS 175.79]